jgi:hypothetical protein
MLRYGTLYECPYVVYVGGRSLRHFLPLRVEDSRLFPPEGTCPLGRGEADCWTHRW